MIHVLSLLNIEIQVEALSLSLSLSQRKITLKDMQYLQ